MRIDDLIPIIFIIIFFVLPVIGRIVEALGGNKKKPESSAEVREYLQKMRGQHARSSQYRAPATKPGVSAMASEPERGKKKKARSEEQEVLEQIALSLEAAKPALAVSAPKEEVSPAPKTAMRVRSVGLRARVLEAPRLSDVQKAIVLKEIFSKPKSLFINLKQ